MTLLVLTATSLTASCVGLEVVRTTASLGAAWYSYNTNETVSVSSCEIMEPIYLEGDISGLTRHDKQRIVTHNEIVARVCGSKDTD